ncbi:hypothetical protein TPA0905_20010 [Streptomyces olivaceus]|nr:hypothetical protein TPA0905_20010 [Streptomyces olivaceus]
MADGHRHFDEAGDPRGCPQMPQVRLDRSDGQRSRSRPGGADDGTERGGLDGVAGWCSRSVQLDVLELCGTDASALVSAAQDVLLCEFVGLGESVTVAAVIHGAPENHALGGVTVGKGVLEPLEHDETAAFARHITVRASVEGVAAAVR